MQQYFYRFVQMIEHRAMDIKLISI